ncbi:MAG: S-methyl-5-thioribose-1-phosphate isomerase [Coriobacteriia bacterium]|nr:S-methyl-5-thioribose-1-phosphate isomerase [Coriobacteriia bacterium]
MGVENLPKTLWWEDGVVHLVDQTRLPLQGDVLVCHTYEGLITAIKSLAVRGAPALGVAGAFALALWSQVEGREMSANDNGVAPAIYFERCAAVADEVIAARPTAINLSWGVRQIGELVQANRDKSPDELHDLIVAHACELATEDETANRALGAAGAGLFDTPTKFLTYCNAGSLATAFYGTALGVIYAAEAVGNVEHVWVCETRPVNQGARLTAWELLQTGIPSALICDNMAADVMAKGWVDAVIVGADRIAVNGDVANKIGTYALAVLARAHEIPFYVAAPMSTFDPDCPTGKDIEIEERDEREVAGVTVSGMIEPTTDTITRAFDALTTEGVCELTLAKGHEMTVDRKGAGYAFDAWFRTTPPQTMIYNPAFDVTPAEYITAYITETGVRIPDC